MTDLTLAEVVVELDKLGRFGRAIVKATEVGTMLASVERAINEKTATATQIDAQIDGAKAELAAANVACEEARNQARAIVAAATKDADGLRVEADRALAKVRAEEGLIRAQTADVKAQGEAARAELNRARAELERVNAAIADAKAEALRRFGG